MRIGCSERNFMVNKVLRNMAAFSREGSVVITASLTLLLFAPAAIGQTTQRPLSDFLDAQGKFCFPDGKGGCRQFLPPVRNLVVWSDLAFSKIAVVDYAGLANACFGGAFGTSMDGKITERALADGQAEVTVLLFTNNALTWVFDFSNGLFPGPLLFGHGWNITSSSSCELDGTPPSLGSSSLEIKFINTRPGAPLPDLVQLLNATALGQPNSVEEFVFQAHSKGILAGGKPGSVTVAQTGSAERIQRGILQASVINLSPH